LSPSMPSSIHSFTIIISTKAATQQKGCGAVWRMQHFAL
jgi:hypothetical protein